VIQVIPLTTTIRGFAPEISVEPDYVNGLQRISAAQGQHVPAASTRSVERIRGNDGPTVLTQIRYMLGLIRGLTRLAPGPR